MRVEARSGRYQDVDVQAIAVAVFKDEKADDGFLKDLDALAGGMVKAVIDSEELKGKEGETVYLHLPTNAKLKTRGLLLIGAGEKQEHDAAQVSMVAGTAVRLLRAKNVKSIGYVSRADLDAESSSAAAVEGAIMALFDLDKYRTVDKEVKAVDLFVVISEADENEIKRGITRGQAIGESVNFTRDLANEPGVV